MKHKISFTVSVVCIALFPLFADEPIINATTEGGRAVELLPDGTWHYAESEKAVTVEEVEYGTKPETSTGVVTGMNGTYKIFYNEEKWKRIDGNNQDAEFSFRHQNGDGYAIVIAERVPIPIQTLEKIALRNAQQAAQEARIVLRGKRIVNGHNILKLSIEGTIDGIPFKYFGYYTSGEWGTIQFITFTATPIFPDYKDDFVELLDGLMLQK